MYVLALVTQKGGSGKSTLAVGLAVAAMENGERVAFVEADPQGTISKWKERRDNPVPAGSGMPGSIDGSPCPACAAAWCSRRERERPAQWLQLSLMQSGGRG